MLQRFVRVITTVPLTALLCSADWVGFCKSDPDSCSTYCLENPLACDAICAADPSMKGCENICCQEETAECLSCQAGQTPEEYCDENRAVTGCDAICGECQNRCSSECKKVHIGNITSTKTCKTRVKNQKALARRPRFLEMNIELDCPFATWFMHNVEICEECSKYHQPCNNTHMACGGCCGTPWHSTLGLNTPTEHSCEDIKEIFLATNTYNLECEVEEEPEEGKPPAPPGEVLFEEDHPEKYWLEELITASCSSAIHEVSCKKVPLKVKFECDDCQNQGSPVLMEKCCNRCVEFAESLENNPAIPAFVQPLVWCSACDDTHIHPEDREKYASMPWPKHKDYAEYTEAKADERFVSFIEDNICTQMRGSCPVDDDRRLRGLSGSNPGCLSLANGTCDGTTEEQRAEALKVEDRPRIVGRRLEITDGAQKNPGMVCEDGEWFVNPSHYPESALKVEKTVEQGTPTDRPDPMTPSTSESAKIDNQTDSDAGSASGASLSILAAGVAITLLSL